MNRNKENVEYIHKLFHCINLICSTTICINYKNFKFCILFPLIILIKFK